MPNYPVTVNYLNCVAFTQKNNAVFDYSSFPRPFFIFAYITSGRAEFTSEEGNFSLSEGDVIFLPKGCTYRSAWYGESPAHHSVFFDTEPLAKPFGTGKYPIQTLPRCQQYAGIFSELCRGEEDPFLLAGKFYALLSELFPKLSGIQALPGDERLWEAVRYLDKNFTEKIMVEDLARAAGYSLSSFYEGFRRITGVSPIVYKNRAAVRAAARLLRDKPDEPIETVAGELGFGSAAYFRRTFEAMMGATPRAYRKGIGGI